MTSDDIKVLVKEFIVSELLWGEGADELTDETRLFSDGILDSMAALRLVAFLEECFGIRLDASEVDARHLDTIELIRTTVIARWSDENARRAP